MTEAVIVALIVAAPPTIAAILNWRLARKASIAMSENTAETVKARAAAVAGVRKGVENAEAISFVAVRVNGERDALIEAGRIMRERIAELEKRLDAQKSPEVSHKPI